MTSKDLSVSKGKEKDKFNLAIPISFEAGTESTPSHISGYGIHPGLFNAVVEIPEDELDNIESTLKGAQLRADHKTDVLSVIGRVNEAFKTFDEQAGKQAVKYEAEIDQDDETALKIQNKIQKGYINASSIGFEHNSLCSVCGENFHTCEHHFGEAHVIAKDCDVYELSIVTMGADGDATATVSGLSKEFVNEFKKQFESKDTQLKHTGGKVMEPKKDDGAQNPLDVGKLVQQLAETQADALDKEKQLSTLQSQMAEQKKSLDKLMKETTDKKEAESTELAAAKKEAEDSKKELAKIKGATNKETVTKLVERQIEVGIVDKDKKDEEIESLLAKGEETVEALIKNVEVLEAKKLADEKKDEKKEGKVPKFDALDKKGAEGKTIDVDDPEVVQYLVHTVFGYKTVFNDDNTKGEKYMGGKV